MQGIEYFVNLQSLYAEVNRIQTLDVSKNVDLITLNVNNNELKSILLPNQEENNTLVYLDVFANQLTSLDVSNLHIQYLKIYSSNNVNLKSIVRT